MMIRLM